MPAVVTMDNGGQGGARSDHDRDIKANGVNGSNADGPVKTPPAATSGDKGKAVAAQPSEPQNEGNRPRMDELPDELKHITEGFVPLSLLLTRLAQNTHNELQKKVAELAKMPIPGAAVNGNAVHSTEDDASAENLRKKGSLLEFAQFQHGRWVKALVLAEWSRKADVVSKLIDLKVHLHEQWLLYEHIFTAQVNLTGELRGLRLPSPDLKTALQVLSTGSAPWMPDLDFIPPPPLEIEEQLKYMNELNTLLSLRLNLDEFDKIPSQFRDYVIDSGRVTFKVDGEFEVDLTVASEDATAQFWFIDFRFGFTPAVLTLPETWRNHFDFEVNNRLANDGLEGCYDFLHELILTCKINELKRQALEMRKDSWTGTIMVESLHRALALQYWTERVSPATPKSWVQIAVNSGKKDKLMEGEKPTSRLEVKWYRDSKATTDAQIPFDSKNLSAETLLRTVIGRHVEYILRGIHEKLLALPRYKEGKFKTQLYISPDDPAESTLKAQAGRKIHIHLTMEPRTGAFAIKPSMVVTFESQRRLNHAVDQVDAGFMCIEDIRASIQENEVKRRAGPQGWHLTKPLLKEDELRGIVMTREPMRTVWLQRRDWPDHWSLVMILSHSGDQWWLIETDPSLKRQQRRSIRLPLAQDPVNFDMQFWPRLIVFTSAFISHATNQQDFSQRQIICRNSEKLGLQSEVLRMPGIDLFLPSIFPALARDPSDAAAAEWLSQSTMADALENQSSNASGAKRAWAKDTVTLTFKNVSTMSQGADLTNADQTSERIMCTSEAFIRVRNPAKLSRLSGRVDRNIYYSPRRGEFSFTIQHALGTSALTALKSRIRAIDRFVCFLEALEKCKDTISSEEVGLRLCSFTYDDKQGSPETQKHRAKLDLSKDEVNVELEDGNPHLRVMDIIRRLVNAEGGIQSLMDWLPASLSAHRALSEMERQWRTSQASGQGRIEVEVTMIDRIRIDYCLLSKDGVERKLSLEALVRLRQKERWWQLKRIGRYNSADPFGAVLQPIWDDRGDGWQGLHSSATGKVCGCGAANLFLKVDEAIRGLIGNLDDEGFAKKDDADPPPEQQQTQRPGPPQQQRPPSQQLPPPPQLQQPPPPRNQAAKKKQGAKPGQPQSGRNADQAIEIG